MVMKRMKSRRTKRRHTWSSYLELLGVHPGTDIVLKVGLSLGRQGHGGVAGRRVGRVALAAIPAHRTQRVSPSEKPTSSSLQFHSIQSRFLHSPASSEGAIPLRPTGS